MDGIRGPIRTVLLRAPNWVGDCVMATPALAAFRKGFPEARIILLTIPYSAQVFEDGPWFDELFILPHREGAAGLVRMLKAAGRLRRREADLGVLMTNSLSSAVFMKLARPGRVLGYSRDGRGMLLTIPLQPRRAGRGFLPMSMVDYYLELARAAGCPTEDRRIRLATTAENEREADALWERHRLGDRRVVGLNPGAAFGSAKCWPPEYFASLAELLAKRGDTDVVVLCGPGEREVAEAILRKARREAVRGLHENDMSLGTLKAVVRRLSLLVTNDTGPRHFACAFAVPTVTIFGPTDERWSETGRTDEIKISQDIDCRPCMDRVCPGDHACMRTIEPEAVYEAALRLMEER